MSDATNPIDDKDPPPEPLSTSERIKGLALTDFREAKTELDGAISAKHLATDRLAAARARFTQAERTARRVGAIPQVGRKPRTEESK